MSDEEDDYLSDKFILESSTSADRAAKTYSQRRKEALRQASIKNELNRKKTRRELELESREEGLSKSLFERAQEEEAEGHEQNKALALMKKMGFKPGQPLGKQDYKEPQQPSKLERPLEVAPDSVTLAPPEVSSGDSSEPPAGKKLVHRVVPLPLSEWTGKVGIGVKRAASPSASERLAKMAKMAEEHTQQDFRDRARQEYEERRAEGRLAPAQRTCATLDEKAGRSFNILWLNPLHPDTFPEGFLDALDDPELVTVLQRQHPHDSIEGRLRARMHADALQPLPSLEEEEEEATTTEAAPRRSLYSEEDIKEAAQFLRLTAQDRLQLVLDYLRRRYAYCFWCGTEYESQEDMEESCPGPDEESHD